MEQTIRETVAPTSRYMLDPEWARVELGLADSFADRIAKLVLRISVMCARELLFDPLYRQVEEGFQGVQERDLLLTGRPLNISPQDAIVEIKHPGSEDSDEEPALVYGTNYSVRYAGRSSGEGSLFSVVGWPPGGHSVAGIILPWAGGNLDDPIDWQATYWCGWWCPLMTLPAGAPAPLDPDAIPEGFIAAPPPGVPLLPEDLQQAVWISVRKAWYEQQTPPNFLVIKQADREIHLRSPLPARGAGNPQTAVRALAQDTIDIIEHYQPVL